MLTAFLAEHSVMTDLLPAWPLLSAFLIASLVLAATPGPGVLYIVTRSIVQGRHAGLASVAGVALGNLGNACAAALGLAALFAVSSLVFAIVKYAGAAYLVWLGLRMLRGTRETPPPGASGAVPLARLFRDGFVVALLNPKTTVFFAAFLPQFLDANAPMAQGLLLGTLFVAIAAVTDSAYALAAGAVTPVLRGNGARRAGRWLGGGTFVGLGLFAALSGSREGQ
jgi:threonine/homoserine/homoserine lactone efflux protein